MIIEYVFHLVPMIMEYVCMCIWMCVVSQTTPLINILYS